MRTASFTKAPTAAEYGRPRMVMRRISRGDGDAMTPRDPSRLRENVRAAFDLATTAIHAAMFRKSGELRLLGTIA
jgi:hypothetical protein